MPSLKPVATKVLTHELKLPFPAALICSSSESSKRMCFMVFALAVERFFSLSSCIGSYQYYNGGTNGNYHVVVTQYHSCKTAKPADATNTNGPLTITSIEVAMTDNITHPQGRNALTLNSLPAFTAFPWNPERLIFRYSYCRQYRGRSPRMVFRLGFAANPL